LVGNLGLRDQLAVDGVEYYGRLSFLKAGLFFANRHDCQSTYARIRAGDGHGLHGLPRHATSLTGILNGIDTTVWVGGTH
jgi:starch synthase